MNKPAYFILSLSCAMTLLLAWVVFGQAKEIEQLKANQPEITNSEVQELKQTVSKLDSIREQNEWNAYWKLPRNAFFKSSIESMFEFGFNDYKRKIEGAKKYFYNDEAYQQYLELIDKLNIIPPMIENQMVLQPIINEKPTCERILEAGSQHGGDCDFRFALKYHSGGQNTLANLQLKIHYIAERPTISIDKYKITELEIIESE